MNIIDQINHNPLVAVILVVVPAIGITWKVFHALYVKPRDFKITTLNDDFKKLQDELVRLRKEQERQFVNSPTSEETKTQLSPETKLQSNPQKDLSVSTPVDSNTKSPLLSLNQCYQKWSDEKLTDLQKQRFEKEFIGKKVEWKVQVDSVSDKKYERIILYVKDSGERLNRARSSAEFPEDDESKLAGLQSGDWIILRGTIKEFFLWPSLKDCTFEKQ
jgi:hypothetical protein